MLAPMEARLVEDIPKGSEWQYEPKWDGFRCLAYKRAEEVELIGKSGKSLRRYFPEIVEALSRAHKPQTFVIDGELIIEIDGRLSFDALQMRLHPAQSRILQLSQKTPARLVAFDILFAAGKWITEQPFSERREALEKFADNLHSPLVSLTEATHRIATARAWLQSGRTDTDGIVAKRLDIDYRFGERAMLKIKRMRTADCVVGGFRYAQGGKTLGSLLLGLYDDEGLLHHVGFTSSVPIADRPELTKQLLKLCAPESFTGDAPGRPSRWATQRSAKWQPVRPLLVAEVRYDHVTGNRFRHGTKFLRWRPDKRPQQCRFDQISPNSRA
ncbi:ATP-dependent DNA ligase [Hyphomicrobium sp. B1]|uniref:ATP-dependent DNA ligase n=2 Tax=Hyphomicrobium TaxID=81 RepID=UPI0039C40617